MTIQLGRITTSGLFATPIQRTRRTATVNDYGETQTTSITEYIRATVTTASGLAAERIPDATQRVGAIVVSTTFELLDAKASHQPDTLTVKGADYTVAAVENYAQNGYYRALCTVRAASGT